jgi:hypothetical protein
MKNMLVALPAPLLIGRSESVPESYPFAGCWMFRDCR